jgi:uncharacterized protein (DUF305 family)
MLFPRARRRSALLLGVLAVTGLLAACGQGGGEQQQQASPERAFLASMVPHHESAVAMAKVSERQAKSDFVRALSEDIVQSQRSEIVQMRRIHERLLGAPLRPDMGAHAQLGLSAQEAGMDHMEGAAQIRDTRPFDRAFVDHMVPHHQGAVRMAEVILERSRDRELRELATDIIAAQRKEIAQMNSFRKREYGGPAPTGGGGHGGGAHGSGGHGGG